MRQALARNADPHTSHLAAREVERSGLGRRQRDMVLAALRRFGRRTSLELAQCADLDRYVIARRLPELERAGLVARGPAVQCPASGRQAITWRAVSQDAEQGRLF